MTITPALIRHQFLQFPLISVEIRVIRDGVRGDDDKFGPVICHHAVTHDDNVIKIRQFTKITQVLQ